MFSDLIRRIKRHAVIRRDAAVAESTVTGLANNMLAERPVCLLGVPANGWDPRFSAFMGRQKERTWTTAVGGRPVSAFMTKQGILLLWYDEKGGRTD